MCNISAADSPPKEKISFDPDLDIQKLINEAAYAKGEEFFKTLDTIEKKIGKNYSKLVPNLIYYSSRAKNMEEGMARYLIIHYMAIGEENALPSLLPYVGADDKLFRKEVETAIMEFEPEFRDHEGFQHINFQGYANKNEWPPRNAMEFLYRKCPGAVLLTMTKAYYSGPETERTRAIRWAEHSVRHVLALKRFNKKDKLPDAIRDAVEALDELSKDMEWWVRLYVAEILNQHPEFQTKEMSDRLKGDKDELVRQAMSR